MRNLVGLVFVGSAIAVVGCSDEELDKFDQNIEDLNDSLKDLETELDQAIEDLDQSISDMETELSS